VVAPALCKALDKSAAESPHMDVLKMNTDDADPVRFTSRQLSKQVNAFARGMIDAQFTPDTKLVVWTKDIAEGVVAQLGGLKAGVQVVCLDSSATESDLSAAMADARALLFSPQLQPQLACMSIVENVIPELKDPDDNGDYIIRSAAWPKLRWVWTTGFERQPGMIKFTNLLNYDPDGGPTGSPLGNITYAGPGSAAEIKELPYFDSTVTFIPNEEEFL
jgi:acyl-CoA synthetase (AMP-forming)/AMP-acid ligase II